MRVTLHAQDFERSPELNIIKWVCSSEILKSLFYLITDSLDGFICPEISLSELSIKAQFALTKQACNTDTKSLTKYTKNIVLNEAL